MRKQFFSFLALTAMALPMSSNAESFTAGGETYTYTVLENKTLSSGVTHHRLRFTSPVTINVNIVTADLSNPDVRVEAFTGSDMALKREAMTTHYTRKKNAGRHPIASQNAHFWSMSSQTTTDAGVYATNTCLGGAMVNGEIITETNFHQDQWNGGPSRTGVLGITSDGKAYIDNYQTLIKVMCPAKWGTDENANYLTVTEVNKYCHASDILALFTPKYPSSTALKVIDSSAGQAGTQVTGTGLEVYLTINSGQTMTHNSWVTATVGKIGTNSSSSTRGNYDLVLVASPGANQNILASIAVGDQMKIKYNWHLCDANRASEAGYSPAFENIVAGNAIVMKDGAITARATDEYYNSRVYSRSAYGVSADGKKVVMCVIDNKADATYGSSSGCSTTRMSYIMKQFGADDVLNMDAGGSAQMAIGGKIINSPSDGSERSIAGGIMIYSVSGDSGTPETPTDQYVEVTPAAGTANPYAFEVTGSVADNKLTVNYVLNTAATAVAVDIKKNGAVVKSVSLGSDYCTEAAHTASIDLAGLAAGEYTWGINVTGATKGAVQEFKSIRFNHPQGIDTDRNFESPYFGRIYVTEGRATTNSVHYSSANGGQGLYMFTPRFIGIQNWITGKYAYTGGVTFDQTVGSKSGADFRKVRVADDGRIFVTRQNDSGNYLYEVPDAATVVQTDAAFTPVFSGGSLNTTTFAYENGSTFIAAPNIGFDLKGSGESLTLAMLSGQATLFSSTVTSVSRLDQYALGSKANWSSAAAPVSALSGKYTVNYSGTNICYDNRGGLWYCQYRQSPTATQPALIYINSAGEQKYLDITTPRGGGGIRFNPDFTQIAIASSESTLSIYDISYSTDGTPTLTEKIRITHGMGKNINDIAWDLANNIYTVSNNGEILKAFSIPRNNNAFTTEAASTYSFSIEAGDLSEGESANEGYTLTQEWEQTEGHLTANSQTRWATAFDGKIYINDHANSKLYYWSESGLSDTGIASAAGTAITSDDAGNIVVSTSMYAGGNTSMKILPAGGNAFQALTITMPEGVTAAQMQYLGKAVGDIMGNGGALYLFPSGATSVAKIIFENGVQTSATTIAVNAITADGQSVAVPLTSDINSNNVAVRLRTSKHFYYHNGTEYVAYPNNSINSTAGGTLFTLGNTLFAVEPIGTNYRDGFQVVNIAKNEVVATHDTQLTTTAVSPNPNCIIAEPINGSTVRLYQYVPGQLATMYTFTASPSVGIDVVEEGNNVEVVAGVGLISIIGEVETVEVYNVAGMLVSRGETEIDCAAGIYIVNVNGQATKVVVR